MADYVREQHQMCSLAFIALQRKKNRPLLVVVSCWYDPHYCGYGVFLSPSLPFHPLFLTLLHTDTTKFYEASFTKNMTIQFGDNEFQTIDDLLAGFGSCPNHLKWMKENTYSTHEDLKRPMGINEDQEMEELTFDKIVGDDDWSMFKNSVQ